MRPTLWSIEQSDHEACYRENKHANHAYKEYDQQYRYQVKGQHNLK